MLHHLQVLPVCCIIQKQNRYKKPRTTNVVEQKRHQGMEHGSKFKLHVQHGVAGASKTRLKRNKMREETITRDERVSPSTYCISTALMRRGIGMQSFQMNPFGAFVYQGILNNIILKGKKNMYATNNSCKTVF